MFLRRKISFFFVVLVIIFALSACSMNSAYVIGDEVEPINETAQSATSDLDVDATIQKFENLIANRLIRDYLNRPAALMPTEKSLQQDLDLLSKLEARLTRLNDSLFTSDTRQKTHQIRLLHQALEIELARWNQSNHLSSLDDLVPALDFNPITKAQLDQISHQITQTPEALFQLQKILEQQKAAGISYPAVLITDAQKYIESLGSTNNNLIFDRYQHLLSYSGLSSSEQKQTFDIFEQSFNESILPAYKHFARNLGAYAESTPILVGGPKSLMDFQQTPEHYQLVISKLTANLTALNESIADLFYGQDMTNSKIREIYNDHKYSLKDQRNAYQIQLNLLSLYIADIRLDLSQWFKQLPTNEVVLAANDQLNNTPFTYKNNMALFSLNALLELPSFELETLAYQYATPGHHLVSEHMGLVPNHYFLAQIYTYGWSIYATNLAWHQGLFREDMSKLGFLTRSRLDVCKAIADFNMQNEKWSTQQAQTFIEDNTPYSSAYILKEIGWLKSNPGVAYGSLLIANELTALRKLALDELGLSEKSFHQIILQQSPSTPDFLATEMPVILAEESKS